MGEMMANKFHLSISVESLFEHWPGTVQVFIQYQMACPGCYLAGFESLAGALNIYQIQEEPFLDDLQQIISGVDERENEGSHPKSSDPKGAL
jgi:hybrid cluster-associated redox disulfide protein